MRTRIASRGVGFALAIGLAACGPASQVKAPDGKAQLLCDEPKACEAALLRGAVDGIDHTRWAEAYLALLVQRDERAALRSLLDRLPTQTDTSGAPIELNAEQDAALATPLGKAFVLGIAQARGLVLLHFKHPDGKLSRAFPGDPISPLMLGLMPWDRPIKLGGGAGDLALERDLRALAAAASRSDFVAGFEIVDRVDAALKNRDRYDTLTLRARLLSHEFGFSKREDAKGDDNAAPKPAAPAPTADETAYTHLLRVRLAGKTEPAFDLRRTAIEAELPQDVRIPFAALFGKQRACETLKLPSFERPRDVGLVSLLPGMLRPARTQARGRLEQDDWYVLHERAARLVDRTQTFYIFGSSLMRERGASAGVLPQGSKTHGYVSSLAKRHAAALLVAAKAAPARFGFDHSGFLMASGNYVDADLRQLVVDVGRSAASGVLTGSDDAWDVVVATVISAFFAMSMPPELQEAHMTALQGSFTEALRGRLSKQSGWGAASAFLLDGVARRLWGLGPDEQKTANEMSRALLAPGVQAPALAALIAAITSYAALAASDGLGTPVIETGTPLPQRANARAALHKALASLGDGANPAALDKLVDYVDASTATAAFAIALALNPPPKARGKQTDECLGGVEPTDPRLVRALGKLRDKRRELLSLSSFREPKTPWERRAGLVVLVQSDVLDLMSALDADTQKRLKAGPKPKDKNERALPVVSFHVPRQQAEALLAGALGDFGVDPDVQGVAVGTYALLRAYGGASSEGLLDAQGKQSLSRLLSGAEKLLSGDQRTGASSKLLAALRAALTEGKNDFEPVVLSSAQRLFAEGQREQGDMLLLSTLLYSLLREQELGDEAIAFAESQKSGVAWAMHFMRDRARLESGKRLNPRGFVKGIDELRTERCAEISIEPVAALHTAIDAARGGELDRARTDLESWLEKNQKTLVLPRIRYAFRQETETRVLNLSLDLSLAATLVGGSSGFQMGLGAKTEGEPVLALDVGIDPPEAASTREDTARHYVHVAALTAVLHYLAKDDVRGELATARVLGLLAQPSWLYFPGQTPEPREWHTTASGTLAVLAQLASERGRPFQAGELWSLLRRQVDLVIGPKEALVGLLDPLPGSLAGLTSLAPVVKRTQESLALLAAGTTCGPKPLDQQRFLRPSCEQYAGALALRVADASVALPELDDRKRLARCPDFAALDGFLRPASQARYEPDRLREAVAALLSANKPHEAALLLTKHRQPNHCAPQILADMRRAGEALSGVASASADLHSSLVNCQTSSLTPGLLVDLKALTDDVRRIGDPTRELEVAMFGAGFALQHSDPKLLSALTDAPDFVKRQRENGPRALGVALLLDHAAKSLAGDQAGQKRSAPEVELLCGAKPPAERVELCRLIGVLSTPARTDDDRKKAAENALRVLIGR